MPPQDIVEPHHIFLTQNNNQQNLQINFQLHIFLQMQFITAHALQFQ